MSVVLCVGVVSHVSEHLPHGYLPCCVSFVHHLSESRCQCLCSFFLFLLYQIISVKIIMFVTTNVGPNALGHLHANDGVDEEEHGDQEDDVGECLE